MTNVQIAIDESLLDEVSKAGEHNGLDLTQVIREALQAWLKRREGLRFEQDWIAALKKNPDEVGRAEVWSEAQTWSES
jgi:hypothetical protein